MAQVINNKDYLLKNYCFPINLVPGPTLNVTLGDWVEVNLKKRVR